MSDTQRTETNDDAVELDRLNRVVIAAIQKGATMKDLHGVTDAAMEGLYAYAYRFYQQGRLKEAESFFRFLFMYDFRCAEYPMGLGAVYQLQGDYPKAIEYYTIAGSLAEDDMRPVFHAAQCHACLGNRAAARRKFEVVMERASMPVLREAAKASLDVMENGGEQVGAKASKKVASS
ncbi:SycD/LcrH family type III secretion system chaperone [Robbsia sp. Bb-Pol-6]|uniref:SycD/LcrH family type III secretion system chaperone n=1 Tax=Robbsia betulipollinis TaxID=2981849 RepID=A0ABT3ZLS5_9BURK|nr:SycD/LcrH family type III secretion system chaperone [Robbsia betulipollinis]MCY0387225.1 SycD/LcrH family type III secretion system chaperone [Robbsia betulipollinis]